MPDASGRFKGISVPALPWLKRPARRPYVPPVHPLLTTSKTSVLSSK